jgi:hypothetical protein
MGYPYLTRVLKMPSPLGKVLVLIKVEEASGEKKDI